MDMTEQTPPLRTGPNFKIHWDEIYSSRQPEAVSWYQREPRISLELIQLAGTLTDGKIIDVGGGASTLVDELLKRSFKNLTVLDISPAALAHVKKRLGRKSTLVNWIEADITDVAFPEKFNLWHDRAVFHFLTGKKDRLKYIENLTKALAPGGHVIIATFAPEGPLKCSGLDVRRYEQNELKRELGKGFDLVKMVNETHLTPGNIEQRFVYCLFKKII
jgi:SAM-dependent methyltransferase